jgi:hypothetical protein
MRFPCFVVLALCSASAFSYDYPALQNPVAKQLMEQYKKDKLLMESPALFTPPASAPAWPCKVPEVEIYKIVGLQAAHPESRAEYEKGMRKAFREAGMSAQMLPTTTFSNIQIIPLKAQCANGKLDGDIELLVSYDKRDESHTSIPSGATVINGITVMSSHVLLRSQRSFNKGEQGRGLTNFMQMTMQNETHYDNQQMEEMTRKNNDQLGLNKPVTTRSIVYTAPDGITATFMESEEKKVSGGLFGVSVTPVPTLLTTVTLPVDEHHTRTQMYKNDGLLSTGGMKDGKPHGEQVLYMENYLKKLHLRLDQQPGMEDSREVTINGVDLIEKHTCMQHGAPVKMSPCPAD